MELGQRDVKVVVAVLIGLWAAAGFSLGWTTSQWPFRWFGYWALAAAGAATNWLFLFMLFAARRESWNEDAGESLAPQHLTALLDMLTGKSFPYWWTVVLSFMLPLAALLKSKGVLLAGVGLSLVIWTTIAWFGFLTACDGYAWRNLPQL
jgi:hypothetical protein